MRALLLLLALCVWAVPACAEATEGQDTPDLMVQLVLQLAIVIFAAKFVGELVERRLHQPAVLGELIAGTIIGPYALGSIHLPGIGPLFPRPDPTAALPVSPELYAIATLASIVLLFLSGLETDLATFLKYSVAGTVVGLGGVIFSFAFGDWITVLLGFADGFMDPIALFMGAVSTATSVGITARILSEQRKMDTPEGVTILAGAVIDDVLGIIVLALVIGISRVRGGGGALDWGAIGLIAVKAFGFWLGSMAIGLAVAKRVSGLLKWLRSRETMGAVAFGFALLLSGLAEKAGLAMIIGAYVMGLSLSRVDIAHELRDRLSSIYSLLVPIFFCVMGMLVDFSSMGHVLVFGLISTILAALAKLLGCGAAALLVGFNLRGAARVGSGMLPRGEVALIVAGVGLAAGAVTQDMFGVAIMMTLVTTLAAPPLLVRLVRGGSGLRSRKGQTAESEVEPITLDLPTVDVAEFILSRILDSFVREEFFVHRMDPAAGLYQVRKEDIALTIRRDRSALRFTSRPEDRDVVRMFVLEEIATLQELLTGLSRLDSMKDLGARLLLD
ncbi:MAG: cation:proton antiporter [Candidatus Eisenbacteria bacterium]|nr:cation:proton antiporter [Candidatus Eisenbacteria bacterium]